MLSVTIRVMLQQAGARERSCSISAEHLFMLAYIVHAKVSKDNIGLHEFSTAPQCRR